MGTDKQLLEAAGKGDVAVIKEALRKDWRGRGANVNCRDAGSRNVTPLHWAASFGHVEAVRALLEAGADVRAKAEVGGIAGMTPLHAAAWVGCLESVQALLQGGADVGAKAEGGDQGCQHVMPLHLAACMGNVEVMQALLQAGADLGAKAEADAGQEDWTPLHVAAGAGRVEAVRALLQAGADVGAKAKDGKTPLEVVGLDKYITAEGKAKMPSTRAVLEEAACHLPERVAPLCPSITTTVTPQRPPASQLVNPDVAGGTALYTGGPVMLVSPLTTSQGQAVVGALVGAGIQAAVEIAGAVATCNPIALVLAPRQLLEAVQMLMQQGQYCRERLNRAVARIAAMEPALKQLGLELQPPLSTGVPLRVVESLCATLLHLAHVMVRLQELQRKLCTKGQGVLRRTLELLKAGGWEQEVDALELELRDTVTQLSAVLSIAHFTQAAQMVRAREELRVAEWQQQSEADQARDLQQLEGLLVEAAGGVKALQQQLEEQKVVLDGQAVGLQQVAEWLQRMHAGSALIAGHLQQLNQQVEGLGQRVGSMHVDVATVKDQMAQLVAVLLPPRQGQTQRKRAPMDSLPDLALPRERIQVVQDLGNALADAKRGAFGGVVQAQWAGHRVALKVYNYAQLGRGDCRDAVNEAVLLCRANHPNVVRCYGVVYDPDSTAVDSIQGSLVMEWAEGGSLYDWLQEEEQEELGLAGRVLLALRVAEGMRHLVEKRLVHGDLKPQNILMATSTAAPDDIVPQVKIGDFGLAKYTATTMHSARNPAKSQAYTLAYTSPERLADFRRTPQDDVYAFGILLHFIATARTPFFGIPAAQLDRAIERGARPDIDRWLEGQASGGVERDVAEVYCRLAKWCWAADPRQRPTFDVVLNDLGAMLTRLQA